MSYRNRKRPDRIRYWPPSSWGMPGAPWKVAVVQHESREGANRHRVGFSHQDAGLLAHAPAHADVGRQFRNAVGDKKQFGGFLELSVGNQREQFMDGRSEEHT